MALQKKTKQILDQRMGGKKQADRIAVAMAADAPLTKQEQRELEILLADKKAAADIAAAIDAPTGAISSRSDKILKTAMITKDAAADMKTNIQS